MNVISRAELFRSANRHPEVRQFVADFYRVARKARWANVTDVRRSYRSADLVGQALVIDVLGNRFRMLFCANFTYRALFFKGLSTHAEYDRGNLGTTLCKT